MIQDFTEEKDPKDSKVSPVPKVSPVSPSPAPPPPGPCTETLAWLETPEALGSLESPVSLACPGVQGQRDVLVLWAAWADPVLLVPLALWVIPDLLDSLDPLESKVSRAQRVVLERPVQWGAVTVSGTRW